MTEKGTAYGVPVKEIETVWDGGISVEHWEVGGVKVVVRRQPQGYRAYVLDPYPYNSVFPCRPRDSLTEARDAGFRVASLFTNNQMIREYRKIHELIRDYAGRV